MKKKKFNNSFHNEVEEEEEEEEIMENKSFKNKSSNKWYDESKYYGVGTDEIKYEEVQKLRTEASSFHAEAVLLNKNRTPQSLTKSDYAWVRTVISKGTRSDKVAAYTLLIQDSPVYNLSLIKNMVEMVKVGKNKECFMAIDTLCELFLNDLLPPNRKLLSFSEQPLSKLNEITSGNANSRKKKLILWYFEDQLKYTYGDFVSSLNKIAHDSVDANKEKVITAMCKLLQGNPEKEQLLLNNIVNKLGDPSHKVGSKVIYVLTKLLETHPNMREVVIDAVEKVIFRTNISKRAQYYSVCFLSQFCLVKADMKIAKQLVSIYLSLFKACIKTGDIDSRMMGALLTGVNRAYPFAKEDLGMLKDHINTIYKVIHLSHANIAIQALSLVYLVSDYSNAYIDRFYSVLYKKVGEPEMFKSSHHAMFLSLIYKALKKDKETARICAFLKKLFQICSYVPVPVACGILVMISEVMRTKKNVLLKEGTADVKPVIKLEDDSDDGEEHYEDVKEEGNEISAMETKGEVEEVKPEILPSDKVFNVEQPQPMKVWTNPEKSERDLEILNYNPFARNPLYSGADKSLYYELCKLCHHFHPTVSLFAKKLLNGERIIYSGDPLQDFTLIRFLDKFSFKNPKVIKSEEEKSFTFSRFGRKKYYTAASVRRLRANTAEYLKHNEKKIPVDELYLYKYMKEKYGKTGFDTNKDDDLESVGSDEFDQMLSGLADGKRDEINFKDEIGKLPVKEKKSKKEEEESDSDIDFADGDAGGDESDEVEEFDGDEVDDFGDDVDLQGSDIDEDELEAELEASGIKLPKLPKMKGNKDKFEKKDRKSGKGNLFASAEEFSALLEENDYNAGGSEALSNKDRADAKQLKWESDRDKWIHKKNFRSKNIKKPQKNFKNQKMFKGGKKKRF